MKKYITKIINFASKYYNLFVNLFKKKKTMSCIKYEDPFFGDITYRSIEFDGNETYIVTKETDNTKKRVTTRYQTLSGNRETEVFNHYTNDGYKECTTDEFNSIK